MVNTPHYPSDPFGDGSRRRDARLKAQEVAWAYPGSKAIRNWRREQERKFGGPFIPPPAPSPRWQRVRAKLRIIAHCLFRLLE